MRNEADSLVFRTEKLLSENEDKIGDDVKTPVQGALTELKAALEGTDDDAVKAGVEKLNTTAAALGQAMYANAQAQSAEGAPADGAEGMPTDEAGATDSPADSDDDVVDAEIVDEDKPAEGGDR